MSKSLLIIFFLVGLFYRLAFIQLFPQPFIFDQEEYRRTAVEIYKRGLYTDTHRTYGAPMLMALSYKLLGQSFFSFRLMHAVLDSATAVLIYLIANDIFKRKKSAQFAFFITLFNPVTSAYVGVALSEVAATFFLTLCFYLFLKFFKKPSLKMALFFAFILGFTPQVKPTFLFFTIFMLLVAVYVMVKNYKRIIVKGLIAFFVIYLYIVPFFYNIVANASLYGQAAPLTVDNLFVREFYISLFIDRALPAERSAPWPSEVHWIYQEYSLAKTPKERHEMANKYLLLSAETIMRNPQKFFLDRIKKLWYVWEKHTIFTYGQKNSELVHLVIYWTNILLLSLTSYGFIRWAKSRYYQKLFGVFFIILVAYISVIHAFSITDGRFSVPVYPLLFLFAGYGIYGLIMYFKLRKGYLPFRK